MRSWNEKMAYLNLYLLGLLEGEQLDNFLKILAQDSELQKELEWQQTLKAGLVLFEEERLLTQIKTIDHEIKNRSRRRGIILFVLLSILIIGGILFFKTQSFKSDQNSSFPSIKLPAEKQDFPIIETDSFINNIDSIEERKAILEEVIAIEEKTDQIPKKITALKKEKRLDNNQISTTNRTIFYKRDTDRIVSYRIQYLLSLDSLLQDSVFKLQIKNPYIVYFQNNRNLNSEQKKLQLNVPPLNQVDSINQETYITGGIVITDDWGGDTTNLLYKERLNVYIPKFSTPEEDLRSDSFLIEAEQFLSLEDEEKIQQDTQWIVALRDTAFVLEEELQVMADLLEMQIASLTSVMGDVDMESSPLFGLSQQIKEMLKTANLGSFSKKEDSLAYAIAKYKFFFPRSEDAVFFQAVYYLQTNELAKARFLFEAIYQNSKKRKWNACLFLALIAFEEEQKEKTKDYIQEVITTKNAPALYKQKAEEMRTILSEK